MKKRFLLAFATLVVFGLLGFLLVTKKGPSAGVDLVIDYKNSQDLKLYDLSETQGDGSNKFISEITSSGSGIKILEDHSYKITYSGAEGFAGGEMVFGPVHEKTYSVEIDPYFSDQKLSSLLEGKELGIHEAVKKNFQHINLYEIQPGKLYRWGEWYGTTLKYVGNDTFNGDVLRVVLKHEQEGWQVKTEIPDITLSKQIFPDIPVDVLRAVNSL
ncbi:hypothetical protein HZB74_03860 [Candidatus Saccharibacteria bacterium]|nr:hypothetical protein [Candidatus Saccharibacteria bacterium]